MGLFSGGMSPVIDIPGIAEEMRPALYAWFSARVVFFTPANDVSRDWDPATDADPTPGLVTTLWDSGSGGALVQPLRAPTLANFGDQNLGIIGCRIQTKMPPSNIVLRSGVLVQVLTGGNDPALERFMYSVNEGFDSSLAWGRIIDTTVVETTTIPLPVGGVTPGYGASYGEAYGA